MKNLTEINPLLIQKLTSQETLVTTLLKVIKLTESFQYWKRKHAPTGNIQTLPGKICNCHYFRFYCPRHSGKFRVPKEGHNKHANFLKQHGGSTSNYKTK